MYVVHYSHIYIYIYTHYYYDVFIVTTMFILIMFIGIPIKPIVGICMYIVYVLVHSFCLSNTPIVWSHVARNLSKPWAIAWRSSKAMKRMGWDESDDMNGIPHNICWWFGTWFLFFHILGIAIPTDFHIFQRGWNHQPGIYICLAPPKKTHVWLPQVHIYIYTHNIYIYIHTYIC